MRLESKGAPNSQDRMIGNPCFHKATARVGASPRRTLQRLGEHFFAFLVVDTPRSSTARRVGKGFHLLAGITAAPLANRGQRDSFAPGDVSGSQSVSSAKNDPRPQRIR